MMREDVGARDLRGLRAVCGLKLRRCHPMTERLPQQPARYQRKLIEIFA
jgi:hypothetical protein